jgi:hypothetical protein
MARIRDFFKSLLGSGSKHPPSKVAPQGPARSYPGRPNTAERPGQKRDAGPARGMRNIHLGIDFGTSWSKLAYRDEQSRGGARSYGVAVRGVDGRETVRIPSLVAIDGQRLYFGAAAEERRAAGKGNIIASLKGRLACPGKYPPYRFDLPNGLCERDIAALLLLHLFHTGKSQIREHCLRLGQEPRISMSVGAPVDTMGRSGLLDGFLDFAGLAYEVERLNGFDLLGGQLPLKTAREVVSEGRRALLPKMEAIRANPQEYVLPEVAAALLWHYYSPTVPSGRYASVDIGAGTTDASFFNKPIQSERYEILPWPFYGARSGPPATDQVDTVLAEAAGVAEWHGCRGRENELTPRLSKSHLQTALGVCGEICNVYRQAFGEAYLKDKRTSQWERYGLILIGGGAQVSLIRNQLINFRVLGDLSSPPEIILAEKPSDFVLEPKFEQDHGFLSVAYGLSCGKSFPLIARPEEIPALDHRLERAHKKVIEDQYD